MVSVEFAHFLGEENISSYHTKSYQEFLKINNASGVILLDDYNFKVSKNINYIFDSPVILESDMVQYTKCLLETLKLEDKDIIHYKGVLLKKNKKWTCAALTSCWYLVRLGIIESKQIKPQPKLINILPKKFKDNEKKVIKILKNINPEIQDKIDYIFIEERV